MQDDCHRALAAREASGFTNRLEVEGSEKVFAVSIHPDSNLRSGGDYVERVVTLAGPGKGDESRVVYRCRGSRVLLVEDFGRETTMRFQPPLVWLDLPLTPGRTWQWEGTALVSIWGTTLTPAPATARGEVLGIEPVQTSGGPVEAIHVGLDLTLQMEGDTGLQHIETWLVTEPHYQVIRRLEREGDGASGGRVMVTTTPPPKEP